jgi:hypothetical protein
MLRSFLLPLKDKSQALDASHNNVMAETVRLLLLFHTLVIFVPEYAQCGSGLSLCPSLKW